MIKSVVKSQDFMLSLDVESAFFHVPIHPKHRKFFSSHLACRHGLHQNVEALRGRTVKLYQDNQTVCGAQELLEMIALKELKTCRQGLHQNVEALRGRTVKLYQDNQTVCGALRKMSSTND
jgi:hypothetical protein